MSHPDDLCHHGNTDTSNEAYLKVQPHIMLIRLPHTNAETYHAYPV